MKDFKLDPFEIFWDKCTITGSPYKDSKRAWKAACDYKDKELSNLRYHTFAHALHYFEKKTGDSRDSITHVKFSGGHGYTCCDVKTETKNYYIDDEMEAAFLLDWARSKGWDIYA